MALSEDAVVSDAGSSYIIVADENGQEVASLEPVAQPVPENMESDSKLLKQ